MKKKGYNFLGLTFLSVILTIFIAMPISKAATISGTIYKEDGSSLVDDATIAVNVFSGTPCGTHTVVTQDTTGNGSFVIVGISPGTYYLRAQKVSGTPSYVDEWWASADSIWDCWGAEAITINNPEDVITNKNFKLDLYGSISGTLYEANGTPIDSLTDVIAFRGFSCDNSEFIELQTGANPTYTITNVPPGTYYVKSSNKNNSWYIDEYYTVSGNTNNGISNSCEEAIQVTVNPGMSIPNIDLQLDSGGRISGTIYKSDGATPITDADIRIFAFSSSGDVCNNRKFVDGTATSNGNYIIGGIPAGSYYLQAFRENGVNYLSEWYSAPSSNVNCNDADIVQVWVGVETKNTHFQLDSGGSITGKLIDESGQPLGNVKVEYDNDETSPHWYQAWSDPKEGTFKLSGIGPGGGQITIFSDPGRYLAGFRRVYYLAPGENKNIGTLTVQKGAVISSMVTMNDVPAQAYDLSVGAKLILDKVETGADGTFSFVLPPGEFTINSEDAADSFTSVPQKVLVTEADVMTHKSIPTIAAYDLSNGDVYNGIVTINNNPPTGAGVMIISFMNNQEYDLNNWGATNPLSISGLFDGSTVSNPYQLVTPTDSTVRLGLIVYKSLSDGNETITLTNSVSALSGGGTYNFTYNNNASMVDGYISWNGEPVFWASVALYRQPGNEFVGFARTDHTGYYVLYNVPDGTYWVEATAEDYNGIYKAPSFNLNGNLSIDLTLSELANVAGDINGDQNVDMSDAILVLQVVIGLNPDGIHLGAAVNADDKIGIAEMIYILQKVSGLRQ